MLPIFLHDVLKRPEEVFLKSEVGKLALLNKLGSQLSQRIHCEKRDILSRTTSYPVKMIAEDLPNPRPLQPNATHIIVRDLDDLREREHARLRGMC